MAVDRAQKSSSPPAESSMPSAAWDGNVPPGAAHSLLRGLLLDDDLYALDHVVAHALDVPGLLHGLDVPLGVGRTHA